MVGKTFCTVWQSVLALTSTGQMTVNMTDVSQLKSAMTELTSSTQQMQSRADTQHRSDQRTAAQLNQMQQMMQNMNTNLHQVCKIEAFLAAWCKHSTSTMYATAMLHQPVRHQQPAHVQGNLTQS